MRVTRKQVIILAAAAIAVAGVALAMRPRPLTVETARVTRGPMEVTVDADGRTRVRDRYVVAAPVAGRVARIVLPEGAVVHAGDPVARLAPLPMDAPAAAQARSRVDAALALAREAGTRVRASREALVLRRRDLERAQRLAEAGAVAPRDIEQARLVVRQAEEDARAAVEHARAAEADVRQTRAALMALGGTKGEDVLVRAPASGRVLRVPERSERVVLAGAPLIELGEPRALEIVVDVLSSDGATIHPGDLVRLERWSGDGNGEEGEGALPGRVREVEPAAFTKVSALGVDEQRVNVIIDVPDAPTTLGDGFRVEARIITWSARDALTVPTSALVREARGWSAYIIDGGRARRREVQVGHMGGAAAEVRTGVAVGDEVILFPSDRISDGTLVASRARQ